MKVICVDEEPRTLEHIRSILKEHPEISEVYSFRSSIDACEFLQLHHADVAFIDICTDGKDGLRSVRGIKRLDESAYIVLTSESSEYAVEAFKLKVDGYLLKPVTSSDVKLEIEYAIYKRSARLRRRMYVQCFGNFEVFIDGRPLRFKRKRTKELMAFLVDRKGAAVSTNEICAIMYDDDANSNKSQIRKMISDLRTTLAEYGVEDVFNKGYNSFSVNKDEFYCDYYDYINGNECIYKGEYMIQYSWAESTFADLIQKNVNKGA